MAERFNRCILRAENSAHFWREGWQLQGSFTQSFLLQFWKSQCPSGSKYSEFSKTPPAFAFWMRLKVVMVAGDDIRQKLEFHHVHLELGALGYIETFLFYWSWGFFPKKPPPWPIFVFENTRVPPLDLKKKIQIAWNHFSIKAIREGISLVYRVNSC